MRSLARWIWNNCPIPHCLRQAITLHYLYPNLPCIKNRKAPFHPGPPLIAGFLQSGLGIGEAARLEVLALRKASFEPELFDISPIHNIKDLTHPDFANSASHSPNGLMILHVNAPEVGKALSFIGDDLISKRPIVGVWAWELPTIPPEWLRATKYLDEIWVPSQFVADAIPSDAPVLVKVVPHPMAPIPDCQSSCLDFELPTDCRIFLCMADGRSDLERKNILGTITAFKKAFRDDPGVMLLIKLHHMPQGDIANRITREVATSSNITILDALLTREEVHSLIEAADVFVSLHRAEGFGLGIAEAMQHGKPVIATAYSGNMEFMDPNTAGLVSARQIPAQGVRHFYSTHMKATWAEPDLNEASSLMKAFYRSRSLRTQTGQKNKSTINAFFEAYSFADAVEDAERRWFD